MISSFIGLIIPLGLGLAALFGALAAHRGHATTGTWTLLISAALYLLISLGFGAALFFSFSGGGSGGGEVLETLMQALMVIWFLTFIGMSVGAFLMTSHWKKLSGEAESLEVLAIQLAQERDAIESADGPVQLQTNDQPLDLS